MKAKEERDNVHEQKKIILGRTRYLYSELKTALHDVDTFDGTVDPVKNFIEMVGKEYPAYVAAVENAPSNPGPCPGGQIWCLPKMECRSPDDCNDVIEW